jgi:hypothetical protein
MENSKEIPHNLKGKPLYDLAILLLGIYPKDLK